jgi:hypothetical protein
VTQPEQPSASCVQCGAPLTSEERAGSWCLPCLRVEPTQEKAWALADVFMGTMDLEHLVAARALAASMLVGADPGRVRAIFGEHDPMLERVIDNYVASGVWEDGHVVLDDLGDQQDDPMACMVLFNLIILCGTGDVVRGPREPPPVPTREGT